MKIDSVLDEDSYVELASFHDYISKTTNDFVRSDIDLKDLYRWLQRPSQYRKELIKLSKYYYIKDGVITDVYDLFKTLPLPYYSINLDSSVSGYQKNKKKIDQFIKKIKVKQLVTDTLFTVISEGTCVWYNRSNKYIQFLNEDEFKIEYMVDGEWQVLYDMEQFAGYTVNSGLLQKIDSAPDEITIKTFNDWKNKKIDRYIPLSLKKTHVFKLRGSRNQPYGVPYAIPAIPAIMHGDLLEKTEKALADRVINQIIIQKIGTMPSADGKTQLPVPKPATEGYHNNLKNLIQKKNDRHSPDDSSTAPLTVPSFISIEELKINMNTFPKEVWERIEKNVYKKLGYSMALNMGGSGGQSFGSSSINVEKIYSIIFYLTDQIEEALNSYMEQMVGNELLNPNIKFSKATILDKETVFKQAEALYTKGRGSLKDLVEAAGYDFDHWLAQVTYENDVLKLDEKLKVHATSYTQSSNDNGRPSENIQTDTKDANNNANSNKNPHPSG